MRKFLTIAAILVAALSLSACEGKEGPLVKAARAKETAMDDERQARDIIDNAAARPINCLLAAPKAFDPATGNPKIWIYRRDDATLECYDTEGYHRTSRRALQKITSVEVKEIIDNTAGLYTAPSPSPTLVPKDPPVTAPAATPVTQSPAPEPLEEIPEPSPSPSLAPLGTGPCCGKT